MVFSNPFMILSMVYTSESLTICSNEIEHLWLT